ncbi:hypothetical protein PMAYCL1PPCAC_24882, partial [Pristionchus mayeri]
YPLQSVIERAEEVLLSSRLISNTEKLRIADHYNLFGLQEHCLSNLKSTADFKTIKDSPIYNEFSNEMKAVLFERVMTVAK